MTGLPRAVTTLALAGLAACGENATPTGPTEGGTASPAPAAGGTAGAVETLPARSAFRTPAGPLTACAVRRPSRAPGESLVASIGRLELGPRSIVRPKLLLRLPAWPGDSIVPACPDSGRLGPARLRPARARAAGKGGRE